MDVDDDNVDCDEDKEQEASTEINIDFNQQDLNFVNFRYQSNVLLTKDDENKLKSFSTEFHPSIIYQHRFTEPIKSNLCLRRFEIRTMFSL